MATKEILRTEPLRGLSWSGNDKKTADVPAGDDFIFNVDNLPEFSETWPTPGDFVIVYRDESNVMQTLPCNYVSNGLTRYTFSHKIDNDVINLSVFKSDGHLEINVRNAKLPIPMNLDLVEFDVFYEDGQPDMFTIDYSGGDNVISYVGAQTTGLVGDTAGFDYVTCEEGYEFSHIVVYDLGGDEPVELARYNEMTCTLLNEWPRDIFIVCEAKSSFDVEWIVDEGVESFRTVREGDYIGFADVVYKEGYGEGTLLVIDAHTGDIITRTAELGVHIYDFISITDSVILELITIADTYLLRVINGEPAEITVSPGMNVEIYAHPAPEGKQFDKWVVSGTEEEIVANIYARETTVNVLVDGIVVTATYKDIPEPPIPTEGDLIFTTTFNRYAIVDVLVKEDGSAGVVNVRRMTETDVDLDDTYETVLRASCTFRQDLIVSVEVIMNKPDNVAANYTVNSTRILINGEEL